MLNGYFYFWQHYFIWRFKMRIKSFVVLFLGLLVSNFSCANDDEKANEMYKRLTKGLNSPSYKQNKTEQLTKQLSEQFIVSMSVMNNPKLIKMQANYARNLYSAYIEEGFSKEEALQLTMSSSASIKLN